MNELPQVFDFDGTEVRMFMDDGEPWWIAKDVCNALGILASARAVSRLDEDELRMRNAHTKVGIRTFQVVSESGLYSLVLTSNKPDAKRFKRWITRDVLPAIRKTGGYVVATGDRLTGEMVVQIGEQMRALERSQAECEQRLTEQAAHIAMIEPDAEYARRIQDSDDLLTSTVIAKQCGISAKALHAFLHEERVIYKQGREWVPYAAYDGKGYCRIITNYVEDAGKVVTRLKWTERGRRLIIDRWYAGGQEVVTQAERAGVKLSVQDGRVVATSDEPVPDAILEGIKRFNGTIADVINAGSETAIRMECE